MPTPKDTTPAELQALVRVARERLIGQINDPNVDATAIVAKLEIFVDVLIARHLGNLADELGRLPHG